MRDEGFVGRMPKTQQAGRGERKGIKTSWYEKRRRWLEKNGEITEVCRQAGGARKNVDGTR